MLYLYLTLPTLIGMVAFSLCYATPSDLDAVVVVFRHGDRTPIRPYPNDPYRNRSIWPVDWGMLTNLGKSRHYELGQYFRQRYSDFLPLTYSEKDIYVRSTDVDRTLMSAESNLAGLYPPVQNDIWREGLAWQPIPIHSTPEEMDAVLAAKKPCDKYDYLIKELFQSEYFRNISHLNHDLYAYLTRYSGETISDLKHIDYLYSTFLIETFNNLTLPDWATKVFPKKMEPWACLSFATATYTKDLARLKTGLYFNELINYFINRTKTVSGAQYYSPKFLMYSAHDTTVANLLNSMGVFEYHCPPYTATIIFELHKPTENSSYVNIYYKNSSEARPIKLPTCEFNCELKHFQQSLSPIVLDVSQWESECNSLILFVGHFKVFILVFVVMLFVTSILSLILVMRRNARRALNNSYLQLPGEEEA